MHKNIVTKHFSKSDKIQDFHMFVDDDPSTLSTDTYIYIYILMI